MDSTDLIDLKISKKLNNGNFYIKLIMLLNETYQRPHGFQPRKKSHKIWFQILNCCFRKIRC